jgi:biopolymer transport protein ExbD
MEEKEFNYINAIPLVDVMLVLLTITLTTATFITQGSIKVNLPTASVKVEKDPEVITVSMTSNKQLFINKIEVTKEHFSEELSKQNKESVVEINADKVLTIDDLTQVLGYVQEAGFKKMSIKTEIPAL